MEMQIAELEHDEIVLDSSSQSTQYNGSFKCLRVLILKLRRYGSHSTIHGLQHVFMSKDRVRQVFWVLAFLAATAAGFMHMSNTAVKYLSNPITSQLRMMSEKVTFPEVTICNLKPTSETIISTPEFRQYIRDKWGYFNGWYTDNKKRRPGETKVQFYERMRRVFNRLFQILWVSGDGRDVSMLDKTLQLLCTYNGQTCYHKNFSLVQNFRFWNCYTFRVDPRNTATGVGGRGAELQLVVFTDGYNAVRMQDMLPDDGNETAKGSHWVAGGIASLMERNRSTEERVPLSLKDYMDSKTSINQLLTEGSYDPGGLRIFIHEKKIYPTLSREFIDVQSDTSSKIILRPMWHSLLSNPSHQCSPPSDTKNISYVRYFGDRSTRIGRRTFLKTDNDYVAEAKQKKVYDHCGCYSHRYPFEVNNSQLCYYVPREGWLHPPAKVLSNVRCHDRWIKVAEKQTYDLMQEFASKRSCEFTLYRPWEQSVTWPRFEHVAEIWEDMIAPQIEKGDEFLPTDDHDHHIFNQSETASMNRRQKVVYYPLLMSDRRCLRYFCGNVLNSSRDGDLGTGSSSDCNITRLRKHYHHAGACVELESLLKNVVSIRIRLLASTADAYVEERSYEWTEALSETGGILGLWIGVSLLAMLEPLEFIYILLRTYRRVGCSGERLAGNEDSGSATGIKTE